MDIGESERWRPLGPQDGDDDTCALAIIPPFCIPLALVRTSSWPNVYKCLVFSIPLPYIGYVLTELLEYLVLHLS